MSAVVFTREGPILRVVLNRPAVLNAVDSSMLKALQAGLREATADPSVRILMIRGAGGCFSAGADIQELAGLDEDGLRAFHRLRENTFAMLERFAAPTMAVIERFALGTGLELALCCDFRIAGEDARLGVPSARLGIVESFEYLSRLVKAVGPSQAKKLIFASERVDARNALSMGLVEEVIAPAALGLRCEELLSVMASNSTVALRGSKKALSLLIEDPSLAAIKDPAWPMVASLKEPDFKEGTRAFLEKRRPRFGEAGPGG